MCYATADTVCYGWHVQALELLCTQAGTWLLQVVPLPVLGCYMAASVRSDDGLGLTGP